MRNNPGGLVDEAAAVADEFLSGGTIYTARHRGQVVDEVKAHAGGSLVDTPAVVLVSAYTASAAELVSGALQDAKRAKIIGSQTFGKGSVQTIFELPGGAGMRLTTEHYYTPAGHAVQADGIHPDIHVNADDTTIPLVRERDLAISRGTSPGRHRLARPRPRPNARSAPMPERRERRPHDSASRTRKRKRAGGASPRSPWTPRRGATRSSRSATAFSSTRGKRAKTGG
jgi:carboxyl-terminal processing protease